MRKECPVTDDRRAIEELLAKWWQATKANDTDTVLALMADDVRFLTPGAEPFGKEQFAEMSRGRTIQVDGRSVVDELEIVDGWAWMVARIDVQMTDESGEVHSRNGYGLTILRKEADGHWVLARDANLLPA
jgi:uncharacterized protein (TIGR02246 family)